MQYSRKYAADFKFLGGKVPWVNNYILKPGFILLVTSFY